MIPGQPLGQAFAERWLVETATLESPDRTETTGWRTEATGVPCRIGKDTGGPVVTAGGAPTVQSPVVYFKRSQPIGIDWRITVTSRGNRRLKVDAFGQAAEAPLLEVQTSGTR